MDLLSKMWAAAGVMAGFEAFCPLFTHDDIVYWQCVPRFDICIILKQILNIHSFQESLNIEHCGDVSKSESAKINFLLNPQILSEIFSFGLADSIPQVKMFRFIFNSAVLRITSV